LRLNLTLAVQQLAVEPLNPKRREAPPASRAGARASAPGGAGLAPHLPAANVTEQRV
jgi:hypothetical protein